MAEQASPKIFQTGAMAIERSVDGDEHGGWGDETSAAIIPATPTPAIAFPWTTFDNGLTINTTEDDSVTSNAFQSSARLVGKFVDLGLGMYDQYKSLNRFFYWYWGFETKPLPVLVVRATLAVNEPVHGDAFTDGEGNSYVFLRVERARNLSHTEVTRYVLRADGPAVMTAIGTLTNGTTAGDDLVVAATTDISGMLYEHLFELDKQGRQLRDFSQAEEDNLTGVGTASAVDYWVTGDQKSLYATFAKRFATYDMRYANSLAKAFMMKWVPADKVTIEGGLLSFIQERKKHLDTTGGGAGFGSEAWTLPCDLGEGQVIPLHWHTSIFVAEQGVDILARTIVATKFDHEEAITEAELGFETPLDNTQDTVSGVALAVPLMEGKYKITGSMTISRHVSENFMDLRDGQTLCKSYTKMVMGWYSQEIFVKQFTLSEAGPNDDAIAAEPLKMEIGWDCAGTEFGTLLEDGDGNSLEVNNSPILFRVRDESPICESTGRDAAGVMA